MNLVDVCWLNNKYCNTIDFNYIIIFLVSFFIGYQASVFLNSKRWRTICGEKK